MTTPVMRIPSAGLFPAILLSLGLTLTGCSSTALPPGKSVLDVADVKSQDPLASLNQPTQTVGNSSGFEWSQQTLSATGQGKAPEGLPTAQAEMAAGNSARVHALADIKAQVRKLPVGTDQTVGSIMNTYLTIRHAVENEINSTPIAGQRPLQQGTVEVQVVLPLQGIAAILQQYHITTDQELPAATETVSAGVPNII